MWRVLLELFLCPDGSVSQKQYRVLGHTLQNGRITKDDSIARNEGPQRLQAAMKLVQPWTLDAGVLPNFRSH